MGANDLLMRILARNETKAAFGEVKSGISSLTGALAGFGIGLSAVGIAKFSAEAVKLAASAMPIEQAFNSMAASLGQNADSMLADLQRISKGAIDQTSLMTAANTAMLLGGKTLASELPTLLEVARAGSIALGQDMQFMFQSIITGIARQSPLILDNLGIVVDQETANRNYAASLGITVEAMTEAQKQQALLNDILRVAPDYIASVGADSVTAAEQVRTLSAATKELQTAWGEMLIKVGATNFIADFAGDISEGVRSIDSYNQMLAISADFAKAGMDREAVAAKAAAGAFGLFGDKTLELIPSIKGLIGVHETLIKLTKPAESGVRATANAVARAVLPTMQWADALSALNMELAKTAMIGSGPMSMAGPVSDLLKNSTDLSDAMNMTVDEWVANMMAGNEIVAEDAKTTAKDVSGAWKNAYNDIKTAAENALTSRSGPTELDFLRTKLGKYQEAPLENSFRLDAIIQRGFDEIAAHPDWAAILKIPPEILAGSADELKLWAMETKQEVDALARPDLINWEAFEAEFAKQQELEAGKALTLDIAAGMGLGIKKPTTADIVNALGMGKPELVAAAIGEGLRTSFEENNPAAALLSALQSQTGKDALEYQKVGEAVGSAIGAKAKETFTNGMNNATFTVSVTMIPTQPAGDDGGGSRYELP